MKKSYAIIIVAFALICVLSITVCLIPKNPIRGELAEVKLEEGAQNLNNNFSAFNNFELNYIYKNGLCEQIQTGRESNYFNYDEKYLLLNGVSYYKERLVAGIEDLQSYYFVENNLLLLRAQISIKEYLSSLYFINLGEINGYISDKNISYKYKNSEYSLNKIKQLQGNLFVIENRLKSAVTLNDCIVTVSFFITLNESQNKKQGFVFELYKLEQNAEKSLKFGLNEIKDQSDYAKVKVLAEYLEIGGN